MYVAGVAVPAIEKNILLIVFLRSKAMAGWGFASSFNDSMQAPNERLFSLSDEWVHWFARKSDNVFDARRQLRLLTDWNRWRRRQKNGWCRAPQSLQVHPAAVLFVKWIRNFSTYSGRHFSVSEVATRRRLYRWHLVLLKNGKQHFKQVEEVLQVLRML